MTAGPEPSAGMSRAQAGSIRNAILALCIVSIVFVFQPFSVTLFGIGMASVVVGGLAFNLVPLCEPGKSFGSIIRAAVIVVVILVAVTGLAIGSAELYGVYLRR